MVLEEVDLHGAVGEVHHHGPARPEPGLQSRDTGQLVLLPNLEMKLTINYSKDVFLSSHLHVSSGLEEMLPHVVLEVVEKLHLLLHISRELVHCVVVLRKEYEC